MFGKMITVLTLLFVLAGHADASDWRSGDEHVTSEICSGDCAFSRAQFQADYYWALKGKYQAQRNVAFCLSTGCDKAVLIDETLGCAWRIVILTSEHSEVDGTDEMNTKEYCSAARLNEVELKNAVQISFEILTAIKTNK